MKSKKQKNLKAVSFRQKDAWNVCNSTIGFGAIKSYINQVSTLTDKVYE